MPLDGSTRKRLKLCCTAKRTTASGKLIKDTSRYLPIISLACPHTRIMTVYSSSFCIQSHISLSPYAHRLSFSAVATDSIHISIANPYNEQLNTSAPTDRTATDQLAFQACRMSGWSMPSRSACSSSTSNSHLTTAGGSSSTRNRQDAMSSIPACSIAVERRGASTGMADRVLSLPVLTLARKPCFATFAGVGGGCDPPLAFPNEAS